MQGTMFRDIVYMMRVIQRIPSSKEAPVLRLVLHDDAACNVMLKSTNNSRLDTEDAIELHWHVH